MKKWYEEEYEFTITVTGYLSFGRESAFTPPEHFCRNGEEIGDTYRSSYGSPVNKDGYGICPKMLQIMFSDMQAVRSGGDLRLVGGCAPYEKDYVCPDGCVCFHLKAKKTGAENFYTGQFYK